MTTRGPARTNDADRAELATLGIGLAVIVEFRDTAPMWGSVRDQYCQDASWRPGRSTSGATSGRSTRKARRAASSARRTIEEPGHLGGMLGVAIIKANTIGALPAAFGLLPQGRLMVDSIYSVAIQIETRVAPPRLDLGTIGPGEHKILRHTLPVGHDFWLGDAADARQLRHFSKTNMRGPAGGSECDSTK